MDEEYQLWPWCKAHDAPAIRGKDEWICYWAKKDEDLDPCLWTETKFIHTGQYWPLAAR